MAEKKPEPQTKEEFDIELARLDLLLRQEQLADLRIQREDANDARKLKQIMRDKVIARQKEQATQLRKLDSLLLSRISDCPHRKGGVDYAGWRRGTKDQFAVCTFQLPNKDYMLWCTRCKNTILPPVDPVRVVLAEMPDLTPWNLTPEKFGWFPKDKSADKAFQAARKLYIEGRKTYRAWLQMPTDNVPSTACFPTQIGGAISWERLYRVVAHETFNIPIFQAERWTASQRPKPKDEEDEEFAEAS